MPVTLSLKTNYSGYHLNGAAFFARCAAQIEKDYPPPISDEIRMQYFSSVTASVLMSVAALESKINEVFLFAVDHNKNVFKDVDDWIIDALSELWPTIDDKPILSKYQLALIISKREQFEKGQSPYQDAQRLINLRNSLVHYKPEWDTDLNNHMKLESFLVNRFQISPYSHENDAFFPKKCIGHGCADWSVKTTIEFISSFYDRLGLHERFHSNNNFSTA